MASKSGVHTLHPVGLILQVLRTLAGFSSMMRCSEEETGTESSGDRHQPRYASFFALFIVAVFLTGTTWGSESEGFSRVPQPGEVLRYKVKWHFLRLGTITVSTYRDSTCTAPADYRVAMVVESNPDLPFISIYEFNESSMRFGVAGSQGFRAKHVDGESCTSVRRVYAESTQTLISRILDDRTGAVIRTDTAAGVTTYLEGPSLFLFARCAIRAGGSRSVPTCVDNVMCSTEFVFDGGCEEVSIAACDAPIRTRHFSGIAHWTGGSSAGVTGEFSGWLSDDTAAVPVRAEMKTVLGPISLELEQWVRNGWSPQPVLQAASK